MESEWKGEEIVAVTAVAASESYTFFTLYVLNNPIYPIYFILPFLANESYDNYLYIGNKLQRKRTLAWGVVTELAQLLASQRALFSHTLPEKWPKPMTPQPFSSEYFRYWSTFFSFLTQSCTHGAKKTKNTQDENMRFLWQGEFVFHWPMSLA